MCNYHSESNKWHLNIVWRWAKFTFPTPRNFPLCMTCSFSAMILRLTSSECHTCFTIGIAWCTAVLKFLKQSDKLLQRKSVVEQKLYFYRSRGRGQEQRDQGLHKTWINFVHLWCFAELTFFCLGISDQLLLVWIPNKIKERKPNDIYQSYLTTFGLINGFEPKNILKWSGRNLLFTWCNFPAWNGWSHLPRKELQENQTSYQVMPRGWQKRRIIHSIRSE